MPLNIKKNLLTLTLAGLSALSIAQPNAARPNRTGGPADRPKLGGDYPIQPVPFTAVKVTDQFWAPRIRLNHEVTIPIALKHCYSTGRVDNFLVAGHLKQGSKFCTEFPFDDTDIYKIIEGASYSLQTFPDKKLDAQVDSLINYVASAQEPDGYTPPAPSTRFTRIPGRA